ncbi:hypothetical protein EZV73_09890 [Acidaminobacter sp. JC074]|uniref:hypothetical protein n=1 Tax=Acidaminobacter sp. JC074 TaxID=2530199 RepID=UPI001F0F6581|nr:hypothetical protein [Acidaminobacter sp. JC074]MCH4887885.1 hypothetical protein [Acidaminobacter sp. JC074]
MKRKLILCMIFVIIITTSAFAEEVDVTIPGFDVTIGDQYIDNAHNKYPMIVYKNITYFPMTWNFSKSLGLETKWDASSGLSIGKASEKEDLKQDLSTSNDLKKVYKASVADFSINLNNKKINNAEETYPILIFRDITYFPLTWRFTVDEFGWQSDFNQSSGLSIVSSVNVDNSMNNNTTVSDINNSSVVVTNNNVDNSVNNSNNIINNYSTTVNNFIDNSITINNMSSSSIDELITALSGLTGEVKNNTFIVMDENNKPLEGAVLYINNEIKGVSDLGGNLPYQASGSSYVRIRKSGYKEYNEQVDLYSGLVKTVKLKSSITKIDNTFSSDNYNLYHSYVEASRTNINVKMLGDMFDYEKHDVSKFEIIDPDTGENVIDSFMENSWGSINHVSFYTPIVTIKRSYNGGNGLVPGKLYKLLVKNHSEEHESTLLAVNEPIVSLDGRAEVSIIGDYVYMKVRIDSSHKRLNDVEFALVDEEGNVIYQETQMFVKAYEEYLEFELVNAKRLKKVRYLYLRPLVKGSVYQPDEQFAKIDTIYEPIMLSYDGSLFRRTANEYADKTLFRCYGYNIAGKTYTVDLEYNFKPIRQLTSTAVKSDDGLLDYVEFEVDFDSLEKGNYHIRFEEFGGFGTFRVE